MKDNAQQLLENAMQLQELAKQMAKSMEVAEKTMQSMVNEVEPQDRKYFNESMSHINKLLQDAKNGGNIT